ncbi:MAG: hypothetical protein HY718_11765 [Planctomycetes bacterium]|nr:hypothetical protein [Planctomycetota bacterium]
MAIDHVRLTAPAVLKDAVCEFYVEVLGFEREHPREDGPTLSLRGFPRSGPRLLIDLMGGETAAPAPAMRRRAVIQVASLRQCADVFAERRLVFEWSRGWFFFDRRLSVLDPAGNWIELAASHPL